jgi:aerobic-type carbon monoxide dehydrogenase small subunit (CoxS/CutS family)
VKVSATLTVNGTAYPIELDPGTNLLAAVRDVVGLTGSKEGCDDSECGACMMLLDGRPVNSCSYLALQAEGSEITTVEGLADGETLAPLQAAFLELGGVQCGFCTPGMLVSATALLASNPSPTEDEVRIGLSGNLCRCTGYDGIVKAVLSVADGSSRDGISPSAAAREAQPLDQPLALLVEGVRLHGEPQHGQAVEGLAGDLDAMASPEVSLHLGRVSAGDREGHHLR